MHVIYSTSPPIRPHGSYPRACLLAPSPLEQCAHRFVGVGRRREAERGHSCKEAEALRHEVELMPADGGRPGVRLPPVIERTSISLAKDYDSKGQLLVSVDLKDFVPVINLTSGHREAPRRRAPGGPGRGRWRRRDLAGWVAAWRNGKASALLFLRQPLALPDIAR
jgi:hypothetical protein